jgi:hypothetical protein
LKVDSMTAAEITANCIGGLSLVVAVASVAVTGLALRRRDQAEKREREVIIVVRKVLRLVRAEPTLIDPSQDEEPVDFETIERDAQRRIADAERRTQRAWKLAEEAQIDGGQLRGRLDELDAQRRTPRRRSIQHGRRALEKHRIIKLAARLPNSWKSFPTCGRGQPSSSSRSWHVHSMPYLLKPRLLEVSSRTHPPAESSLLDLSQSCPKRTLCVPLRQGERFSL